MNGKEFLKACGWEDIGSGSYLLKKSGVHLHLVVNGRGLENIDVGTLNSRQEHISCYKQIKSRIKMLCITIEKQKANKHVYFIDYNGNYQEKNIEFAESKVYNLCDSNFDASILWEELLNIFIALGVWE